MPRSSTGAPQPDGALNSAARIKIRHYRQLHADRPDPIVFLAVSVTTSVHVYHDFVRLFFLHAHRKASILAGELPEESEQFRFLRAERLVNLKGSVGLIKFNQILRNEGYSHRFVFVVFHTRTSLFELSSSTSFS